jgi:hydroxyacylglutathione hydrolase
MMIKQFEDKGLAHFSYALLSGDQVVIIDPSRDPQPYYDFAAEHQANIVGVIETHPHADFVSAHLEIHQDTGATIYVSQKVGADYPHQPFDEGNVLDLPQGVQLKALHTPGHSPDSLSILVTVDGKQEAVFTGDTLFIGDVGRPDLRESAGNMTAKREELARMMYHSTRQKLMTLEDAVQVFPAHGSGSLCGKSLSDATSSTIGIEKQSNYALQPMSEEAFVKVLLADQPFIPKYFPYDVGLNKAGAPSYRQSIEAVKRESKNFQTPKNALLIDGRPESEFKASHRKGALNIQNGGKFETWLGSIVGPDEKFYLMAQSEEAVEDLIGKAAKIGYELNIEAAFVYDQKGEESSAVFDNEKFANQTQDYYIVDVRNFGEAKDHKVFEQAVLIPLPELRERAGEIQTDKPIVVHCAGGYRSAAGSSILQALLPSATVLDLSEAIAQYKV